MVEMDPSFKSRPPWTYKLFKYRVTFLEARPDDLQFFVLLLENETTVVGATLWQFSLQSHFHPLILLQSNKMEQNALSDYSKEILSFKRAIAFSEGFYLQSSGALIGLC